MAQIVAQKCEFSCDEVAVLFCKGCDQFLCVDCRQNVHDRVRKFKDHEMVNIHKEGNRVRPSPLCETHKNQFLYYCRKCECLTCAECMTSSHNEHKTEKIKIVADARRQKVNQIIEQLKTKVDIVKKKLETIDTEHTIQIKSDCEFYVKAVEETVDDLHTIVDRHKLIPMTTAFDFKDIENDDLCKKRAFFRSRHDETADRLLRFENLLLETHDSTFLTEWKDLQTDVQMNDEETEDPLLAPRRIEIFSQKKLTRSIIDDIDSKFQMRLKEQEQTVVRLTEGMDSLKSELKEKQEQIDNLAISSREVKENEKKVNELLEENDKLKTELKERKFQTLTEIRMVAFGLQSSSGVSATANTILGEKLFAEGLSFDCTTTRCQMASRTRFGHILKVVDTPAFEFNEQMRTAADLFPGLECSIRLLEPGPHIVLVILPLDGTIKELHLTIRFLKCFENLSKHVILIFTKIDRIKQDRVRLEKIIHESDNLSELLEFCGKRVVLFDNKSKSEQQVIEMLNVVKEVIKRNESECFNTSYFSHKTNKMLEQVIKDHMEFLE